MYFVKLTAEGTGKAFSYAFYVKPSDDDLAQIKAKFRKKQLSKLPENDKIPIQASFSEWTDQVMDLRQRDDAMISLFDESPPDNILDEEQEKAAKRLIGLPITKPIVYMDHAKNEHGKWEYVPHSVQTIRLNKQYPTWCSLRIHTESGLDVNIHCDFLSNMQDADFIEKISHYTEEE